jgi:hypothetical protein
VKVTKDFTDIIKMIVYKSPNGLSAVVPVVGLRKCHMRSHPKANIQIDTLTGQESHYLPILKRRHPEGAFISHKRRIETVIALPKKVMAVVKSNNQCCHQMPMIKRDNWKRLDL